MTVLDCHKGYWHQQLDEQSSYLTTFNTEFGRQVHCHAIWGNSGRGCLPVQAG